MKDAQAQSQSPSSPNDLLAQAIALHRAGNLDEAETIYTNLLAAYPTNVDMLTLLGTLHIQRGNSEEAIRLLDKAIALKPDHVEAYNNRGSVLNQLKRYNEALASYDKVIQLNPSHTEAYYNRAIVLNSLKRYSDALESLDKVVAAKPNYVEAHLNRGVALQELKRYDEALASHERVIALKLDYAEAHNNRGNVLNDLKRYSEALECFDKVILLNPSYAETHNNRGFALYNLKRYGEALVSYEKAITLRPDYADAYVNRGNTLHHLKRYDEALASYDKALVVEPDCAETYHNQGNVFSHLRRYSEALASYDKALAIDPDCADVYWGKALVKLTLGEYEEGWKLFEWRWKTDHMATALRSFTKPLWIGAESLVGKTILLYAEQGLGDTIQMCRYIPMLEALGAQIIVDVPPVLHGLFSTLKSSYRLLGAQEENFDFQCPLMSLPLALKTTINTVPADIPYLYADPDKRKAWQEKLGNKTRPRIGLAWSGNPAHKNDLNRSIALNLLTPLLECNVEFHSLQKEIRAEDKTLFASSNIISHAEDLKDFADTAALIAEMDIVISVDTSVAHLTGALGKPVWILLPFGPDYRWLLEREDSPWYPTARLFRQLQQDDWEGVIVRVKVELGAL